MSAIGALGTSLAVWVVLATAAGAAISLVWPLLARRLDRWHPVDRARGLAAVAWTPILLPTAVLAIVLAPGLIGLVVPALDHCGLHPDHLHLCLVHPGAVLPAPLASALGLATCLALGLAASTWRTALVRARPLHQMAALATRRLAPEVDLVESERPFAFTFGLLRPRAVVSSSLLRTLDPPQRDAVITHEAEHARRRDPLRQLAARLASIFLWPGVRRALLTELALSAEQACDEVAAGRTTDRLAVAQTILAVERLVGASHRDTHRAGAGIDGGSVGARVESLLAAPPPRLPHRLMLIPGLLLLGVLAARPLHHEIEHLLAWALGTG
jgi:Zn-dependent protease with chaperone function